MKWQKAKMLRCQRLPHIVGKFLWVKIGAPSLSLSRDYLTGEIRNPSLSYRISLLDRNGKTMLVCADQVELFPEFAEDVPFLSFDEWLQKREVAL